MGGELLPTLFSGPFDECLINNGASRAVNEVHLHPNTALLRPVTSRVEDVKYDTGGYG